MKSSKFIHFIGRIQGILPFTNTNWFLENARNKEINGIQKNKLLKITNSIKKADVIFIRNKPESTTDYQAEKIESKVKNYRSQKIIINDIKDFNRIDNKDITFEIWNTNGIKFPEYCVLNHLDIDESIDKINSMLKNKESILLRINNRTGGTAMQKITSHSSKSQLRQSLKKLNLQVLNYQKERALTNLLAVEHINNGNETYTHAYRAHILNNQIISYYVAISKTLVVSMSKLENSDLDEFIKVNSEFTELLKIKSFKEKILNAMSSISNMGAVDFLVVNNEPIFLEINPMWKGNFFEYKFGDNKVLLDWFYNKPELENKIPNVFKFKDPVQYWKNFYTKLLG